MLRSPAKGERLQVVAREREFLVLRPNSPLRLGLFPFLSAWIKSSFDSMGIPVDDGGADIDLILVRVCTQ